MNPLLKFVVFVIVGPMAMGLLYFAVMKPAVISATRELTNTMQSPSATVANRREAPQAGAAGQATEVPRAQLEAQAAQARSDMAAARTEQAIAARKDAAWQAFFKPKTVCDNPPDYDTQVECGNAYMRAKREFEDRWERGEFQQP